ncbi:MAG TPA: hypothetical protein VJN69_14470 [Candidatus Acidoferrales bacterium]|nr:hypothetical protein [Candidatus Acidoferrales bacterium]
MPTSLGTGVTQAIQWSAAAWAELSADPGSIPANSSKQVTITVFSNPPAPIPPVIPIAAIAPLNGVAINGNSAWALPAAIGIQSVSISSDGHVNTVTITFVNNSGSPVDPGTVRFLLVRLGGN